MESGGLIPPGILKLALLDALASGPRIEHDLVDSLDQDVCFILMS